MSSLGDVPGSQEVEDLFNEEIFGARPTAVENPPPFPDAGPDTPESKPISEIEEEPAQEEVPPTQEPDTETPAEEPEPESQEPEEPSDPEHIAWARKQYGDTLDLSNPDVELLARAAYEKERMLGKQAQESKELREERERRELQQRIDALNTPGVLTPEEDVWVDEALGANDPGEYAYDALQAGRPDLYAAILDRWATLGEVESRRARILHSQVLRLVSQPLPSEQEQYTAALGQTFSELGLDIREHGPVILAKAEELGTTHPAVQGIMSQDGDVRRVSARAIFDLVATGQATVTKLRTNDVVEGRVQEERLRQQAAGIQTGSPARDGEQPKRSPFWEQFDEELTERGWDGNRPTYGRGD